MKTTPLRYSKAQRNGFTLMELLTVIAVLALLGSIVAATASTIFETAAKTKEVSVARNLITTYLLFPAEHSGRLMQSNGREDNLSVRGFDNTVFPQGDFAALRWPWKLANLSPDGTHMLFIEEHDEWHQELLRGRNSYTISGSPSFGINKYFVGGDYESTSLSPSATKSIFNKTARYPREYCVTRLHSAFKASDLIVFCSSSTKSYGWSEGTTGNYYVSPPIMPNGLRWGSYSEEKPGTMGNVDLRREGGTEAVVANLDGSVELLNEEELRDMRRWSNQAAIADNPNFSDFSN